MDYDSDRSARSRFGGEIEIDLGWAKANVGEVLTYAGPGQGFSMAPWILDRYERVLRLPPGPAWLLKRLMKHAWRYSEPVFPSLRQISREAIVSRTTLQNWIGTLCKLNLIRLVAERRGLDMRRRYDVSPVYSALALCEMAVPTSLWAKRHGRPLSILEVQEWMERLPGMDGRPSRFNLDLEALGQLIEHVELAMADDE